MPALPLRTATSATRLHPWRCLGSLSWLLFWCWRTCVSCFSCHILIFSWVDHWITWDKRNKRRLENYIVRLSHSWRCWRSWRTWRQWRWRTWWQWRNEIFVRIIHLIIHWLVRFKRLLRNIWRLLKTRWHVNVWRRLIWPRTRTLCPKQNNRPLAGIKTWVVNSINLGNKNVLGFFLFPHDAICGIILLIGWIP